MLRYKKWRKRSCGLGTIGRIKEKSEASPFAGRLDFANSYFAECLKYEKKDGGQPKQLIGECPRHKGGRKEPSSYTGTAQAARSERGNKIVNGVCAV